MKDIQSAARPKWHRSPWIWVPVLGAGITLLNELFNHKVFTEGFSAFAAFAAGHPLALAVDFLLVLITLAPAFFFRRRVFYLTMIASIWVVGGGVNGFILLNRMTPFTTADLTVLNTGLDTLPNYLSTKYIVLLFAAVLLLLLALAALLWKGPKNSESVRRRLLSGALATAASFALLAGGWIGAFRTGNLSNVFYNLAGAYDEYGFAYCFLQTWLNTGIRCPIGYSAADMERIRTEIETDAKKLNPIEDVNVIYVQLESFMDPDEVKGLTLSQDPIPNWHAMEQSSTTGYLTVPVVGAGTANTECEVLTGMSTRYFGPGEYPYKTCLLDQTVESVAYDLKALGYATHAVHNHRATFYGRNQVFANLGFDDFTSLEMMPKTVKTPINWAKDYILTSQILQALDATPNQPDLVFTVSVQGHGKYPTEKVLQNPAITVTACPKQVNQNAVEYYINQIHEMDQFLGQLTQSLSQRDEKCVLVLYGDHLPALGLTSDDMASGTLYHSKYIIWSNFKLRKDDEDLCAYQLSASVLKKIGVSGGLMNQFQQYCQDEPTYRMDLRKIQYDTLYGKKYLTDGTSLYEPTDMQMGVAPIQIQNLIEKDGAWYVIGRNFTPYCHVTRDGKVLKTTYLNSVTLRLEEDPNTADYRDLGIKVEDMHKVVLKVIDPINNTAAK